MEKNKPNLLSLYNIIVYDIKEAGLRKGFKVDVTNTDKGVDCSIIGTTDGYKMSLSFDDYMRYSEKGILEQIVGASYMSHLILEMICKRYSDKEYAEVREGLLKMWESDEETHIEHLFEDDKEPIEC